MLFPGIKLGPRDWLNKLDESESGAAEIWFRIDTPEQYTPLLQELRRRGVVFGLHFWGITSSGHEANLAYPGNERIESMEQVKSCLEIASKWRAVYVNIHSGNRALFNLDLKQMTLAPDLRYPVISDTESVALRNRSLTTLADHSRKLDVRLLVEPIPARVSSGNWYNQDSRLHAVDAYPTGLNGLAALCQDGLIGFTNDFCHLMAVDYDKPRHTLWNEFYKRTVEFAPFTEVIHVNTVIPPYNGTDSHGGILMEDFGKPGVFPTADEYRQLFRLFDNDERTILLIGEPSDHHVENYRALKTLLSQTE